MTSPSAWRKILPIKTAVECWIRVPRLIQAKRSRASPGSLNRTLVFVGKDFRG